MAKVEFSSDVEFKWYTVLCAHNLEYKSAENIKKRFESMGFPNYIKDIIVPIVEVEEVNAAGKKTKKKKRIYEGGYIFIQMVMNNTTWGVVRQTPGVIGWLNADGKPAEVSDSEIFKIKASAGLIEKEKETLNAAFLGKLGDNISIKNHNLVAGLTAKITGISEDKKTIKVIAENGFKLELEPYQIEIIKTI